MELIAFAAGLTLGLAGLALFLLSRSGRLQKKKEVLVVLKSGETLRGVLLHRWPSQLELGAAALLSGETATPIDGTVRLDRDNVVWVQVVH